MILGVNYDLSLAEAAELLGREPSWMRRLCEGGKLKARKVGRAWIIRRRDAERFVDTHGRGNYGRVD